MVHVARNMFNNFDDILAFLNKEENMSRSLL